MARMIMVAALLLLAGAGRVTKTKTDLAVAPPKDASKDNGHDEACGALLLAYGIGVATVPVPVVGAVVQLVSLITCCPAWVVEKVRAKAATMGQSESESWALEYANLTHAQIEEKSADEQREILLDLYNDLVYDQKLHNAKSRFGKMNNLAKHKFGHFSNARFGAENTASNLEVIQELEEKEPWLVYSRLVSAHIHKDLSVEERMEFVQAMEMMKTENPWLPTVEDLGIKPDESLPRILMKPESLLAFEQAAQDEAVVQKQSGVNEDSTVAQRMGASLGAGKDAACAAIASVCTRGVKAMKRWMKKPNSEQLEDLKGKVKAMIAIAA